MYPVLQSATLYIEETGHTYNFAASFGPNDMYKMIVREGGKAIEVVEQYSPAKLTDIIISEGKRYEKEGRNVTIGMFDGKKKLLAKVIINEGGELTKENDGTH